MTRVGFYVVQDASLEAANHVAAVLAEKAFQRGHRIFVLTQDLRHSEAVHAAFWSFRRDGFLPCTLGDSDAHSPIVIHHDLPTANHHDCLINLSLKTDSFASRFQRIVEIVTQQESHLNAMREAWRWYKHRGFRLEKHDVARPNPV
jgi:DNA polymerase-3 subunit chi